MWHWQTLSSSPRWKMKQLSLRWWLGWMWCDATVHQHQVECQANPEPIVTWVMEGKDLGWRDRVRGVREKPPLARFLTICGTAASYSLVPSPGRRRDGSDPGVVVVVVVFRWRHPFARTYLVEKSSSHEWTMSSSWIMSIKQSIHVPPWFSSVSCTELLFSRLTSVSPSGPCRCRSDQQLPADTI